ncbi:unnamed protein product [Boreogadus saida]
MLSGNAPKQKRALRTRLLAQQLHSKHFSRQGHLGWAPPSGNDESEQRTISHTTTTLQKRPLWWGRAPLAPNAKTPLDLTLILWRPGNHGHRGPGNADSTKTDRTQRKAFSWRLRSEQLELNKRKKENRL